MKSYYKSAGKRYLKKIGPRYTSNYSYKKYKCEKTLVIIEYDNQNKMYFIYQTGKSTKRSISKSWSGCRRTCTTSTEKNLGDISHWLAITSVGLLNFTIRMYCFRKLQKSLGLWKCICGKNK